MLRIVWGKISKQTFLPFWGVSFPLLWDKSEPLLFIAACVCLDSFLHPSLWEVFLCAFVVLELFQGQIVDVKDSNFQENQRMGCITAQYKPWLRGAAFFGELLVAASNSQSAAWWELPRAWPFQAVGCRAAVPWVSWWLRGCACQWLHVSSLCACEKGSCGGCDEKWPCWLQSC